MKREAGTSLVEAAIAIPVFLVLIIGTLGFGIIYANYQAITHAARDGARFGAAPMPGNTAPAPPAPPQPAAAVAQKICSYLVKGISLDACSSYDGSTAPPSVANCIVLGGTVPSADGIYVTQCPVLLENRITVWYTEVDIRKHVRMPLLPDIPLRTTAAMRNETN